MKKEPEFQNQHKIPQVYLNQFGYKSKLSILKVGTSKIENVSISEFSSEINIFDLPFDNDKIKRHYENLFNRIETRYKTILSNLKNQGKLIPKDKYYLIAFIVSIMCRTEPFRLKISDLIKNEKTREKFIKEITIFSNDYNETKELLDIFKMDYKLNMALGTVISHLIRVFSHFEIVIIKEKKGESWLTTDNPVYIDFKENHSYIIPIEAEVYFPLSKEYCLFMFHPESKNKKNPLRNLTINKVNNINFELFDKIVKEIANNFYEYIIINN